MALELTIGLFGTPKGWDSQIDLYLALLADLPLDLLLRGVFLAMRHGTFFPKPAEIREHVSDELARRRRIEVRLSVALAQAKKQEPAPPPPTEAEKRHVDNIVAGLARQLDASPRGRAKGAPRMSAAARHTMSAELEQFRTKFNNQAGEH